MAASESGSAQTPLGAGSTSQPKSSGPIVKHQVQVSFKKCLCFCNCVTLCANNFFIDL
ncbi:hypothetical protein RchiOBHm_Chr2g0148531 [Rosa chinensis]|uniref:Uncharacterized protein n=1 Tax=Rosa chinensis TaxID=74649 RepID=A0A2P6RZG2_ROSCH|nr:hypothetical protein RchiOBHm_Chr2g0148531 [Rosa chinensis]